MEMKEIHLKTKYLNEQAYVELLDYHNGRTAIRLTSSIGEPLMTATVNLPEVNLDKNQVLIKDWSENEGVLACLTTAGIIENTGLTVPTGFCHANICRLL
jgi:hypothetical protein